MEPLYVIGYPGPVGGACTELWHLLKLWRRNGLEVHLIPTWNSPADEWQRRCGALGCVTHQAGPSREALSAIPGLANGLAISFCNEYCLQSADLFRALGCRMIWVGCMNWLFGLERKVYPVLGPFDAYVCQSVYQRRTLGPQLAAYGARADSIHLIRGWLDPEEFSFSPRARDDEPFTIGRVSRGAPDKFSSNTWAIYDRIDYPSKRVRVLGWDQAVGRAIGAPPAWAQCLPANSEPVGDFLASLHVYMQINGSAVENWPRSGLEAMAAGVPIVAEARGGWCEMIEHGRTGYLCRTDAELAHWAAHLAYDDDCRQEMARRAWLALIRRLADPDDTWARWKLLFGSIRPRRRARAKRRPKTESLMCASASL